MTKELKIGIFATAIILVSIWGYTFVNGQNMLTSNNIFIVEYDSVDKLAASTPVLVRGLQVGTVIDLYLNPDDYKSIIVEMSVEKRFKIPKNAIAAVRSVSLVGGKELFLEFDKPCSGADCAVSGDYLIGENKSMIQSLVGDDNIDEITNKLKEAVSNVMGGDSLSGGSTMGSIDEITRNLAGITEQLNANLSEITRNLAVSLRNLNKVTTVLANNEEALEGTLQNVNKLTGKLGDVDLGKTIDLTNESITGMKKTLENLDVTLASTNSTFSNSTKYLRSSMERKEL